MAKGVNRDKFDDGELSHVSVPSFCYPGTLFRVALDTMYRLLMNDLANIRSAWTSPSYWIPRKTIAASTSSTHEG